MSAYDHRTPGGPPARALGAVAMASYFLPGLAQLWPGLREAQSMTLKLPNTGQAVIIDIGQGDNIHPKDKLDVGHRLALAARHVAYGQDLVFSGPTYDSIQIEGNKAKIKFKNVGAGLTIAVGPSTQPSAPPAEPSRPR